jgi:hypothetical protein
MGGNRSRLGGSRWPQWHFRQPPAQRIPENGGCHLNSFFAANAHPEREIVEIWEVIVRAWEALAGRNGIFVSRERNEFPKTVDVTLTASGQPRFG